MKIDTQTTQAELEALARAVLRRELLRATPLNLRVFLRHLVLFLLFPGMVFGFRAGMLLTVIYCALLAAVLVLGSPAAGTIAIYTWLALGIGVLAFVQIGVLRKALRDHHRRQGTRAAQRGLHHCLTQPADYPLRWHPHGKKDFLVARLNLQAPKTGLYALLLSIEAYDGRRIITGGVTGTVIVHAQGKPGAQLQSLTLYRLEAGCHELSWAVPGAAQGAPQARLSLLNRM